MNFIIASLFLISGLLLSSTSPISARNISFLNYEEIKNCELDYIIKYSNTEGNFYAEYFNKYPDVHYEQALCDNYINQYLDEFYERLSIIYKTEKDKTLSKNSDCIINSMKKRNMSYKIEFLFIGSSTFPILSKSMKREMTKNIERSMDIFVRLIINKCSQDDVQSEYFDELVKEKDRDLVVERIVMYCWKKNLIDNVSLSDETYDGDCTHIIETTNLFEKASANTNRCIKKYIEKHQMFEVVTRIIVLANEKSFTDKQKFSEKRSFMEKIKSLYTDVESNC